MGRDQAVGKALNAALGWALCKAALAERYLGTSGYLGVDPRRHWLELGVSERREGSQCRVR